MSSGGKKGGGSDQPAEKTTLSNPISFYMSQTGKYPSNAEQWWAYKRPVEAGTDEIKIYLEVFDPGKRHQITIGNQPAPKGHFLLNAFHKDRSAVSGIGGIDVQSAGSARPQACAFYAGRVFFAGTNSFGFSTDIYFSQILERADQVSAAHQSLDPTNEDIGDLLPSDGGVIPIPEVDNVIALYPIGMALFVFAENGVWQISGSEGIGFRANDFSVTKISGVPAISNMSFVDVEGSPMWWNKTGIYTVVMEGVQGRVQSLSEDTIKSFFDDIPGDNKFYAKGAYNSLTRRVQWVYRSEAASNFNENFTYDRILNFDVNTGAFYPWAVDSANGQVAIKGIFSNEGYQTIETVEAVEANGETVVANGENVTTIVRTRESVQDVFKYIIDIGEPDVTAPPAVVA